jgi:hypothetical protein
MLDARKDTPMGWLHDEHPGHEGYVVGLVEEDKSQGRWRELREGDKDKGARVERIKVACDCGWRSRVFHAGLRADWWPNIVELHDERLEIAARAVWTAHLEEEARRELDQQQGSKTYSLMPIETWT